MAKETELTIMKSEPYHTVIILALNSNQRRTETGPEFERQGHS